MKKIVLRFRAIDKTNFDEIKNGNKKYETRAASPKYQNIQSGDILVIICGQEKIERKAKTVQHFKTLDDLFRAINFQVIMPKARNLEEAKSVYSTYPGYEKKLHQFGVVALEI